MERKSSYQYFLKNWPFLLGLFFFFFLGILSILLYQERTLSFDTATFAFELIQTKMFFTPLNRFGSMLSQIVPLWVINYGCSLKTFLKIYSLNFILINFSLFYIITRPLKNSKVGIIFLLVLCLSVRNTFYFSASEFSQGLSFVVLILALLYSLIDSNSNFIKILYALVITITSCCLYYFHQLLLIPLILVFVYFIISNKVYKNVFIWTSFITIVLWFGIKLMLLPKDGYEKGKIPNGEMFVTQVPNFFQLPSWEYLVYFFEKEFYILPVLFVGIVGVLFYKRKFLISILLTGFIVSYIILITITYYLGASENMYEQYFIVFGLPIALGLNELIINHLKFRNLIITTTLLIFGGYGIYQSHHVVSQRVNYLKLLLKYGNQYENKKFVIHPNDFPWGYAWVRWALPAETILCSSLDGKQNTITCYLALKDEVVDISANNGQLLGEGWMKNVLNVSALDTNYFLLPLRTNYLVTNRLNKNVSFVKETIRNNKVWLEEIKRKANLLGISIEESVEQNARYVVDNAPIEDKLKFIVGNKIDPCLIIEQEIRNNKEWMGQIKIKAIEKNISIDNMIKIDAQYILDQQKNKSK